MKKTHEVKKIIEFIDAKIKGINEKLKAYESPIMQELARSSSHLQYDYTRLKTELETYENLLLTINKFTDEPGKEGVEEK